MPDLKPSDSAESALHPWLTAWHRGWTTLGTRLPVLRDALRLAGEADVVDRAAALALFCIFAAVPTLFLGFSVLGFVLGFVDEAGNVTGMDLSLQSGSLARLTRWLQEALPGVTWNPADFASALVRDRAQNGILGTVLAISLGLTVFARMDAAVRAIFGKQPRSALRAAGGVSLFVLVAALAAVLLTLFAPLSEWGLSVAQRGMARLPLGHFDWIPLAIAATQTLPVAVCFVWQVRWSAGRRVSQRRLIVTALPPY